MDFVFKKECGKDSLQQGDLLLKTPALSAALKEAHSYYAEADDYTHFLVLTQSCELVRRQGQPKAEYITIAAVRPLSVVLDRYLKKFRLKGDVPFPLYNSQKRLLAEQFLERLLHNTQEGYFFLRKGSNPSIDRDMCAFLKLSVALKISHYNVCLDAKVAQLEEIFAAKVGWLSGNLYSRIATPDIEEKVGNPDQYKESFYKETLFSNTAWLTKDQHRELKKQISNWKESNPAQPISQDVARALISKIPDPISLISQRIVDVLAQNNLLTNDTESTEKSKTLLENDTALGQLIRSFC